MRPIALHESVLGPTRSIGRRRRRPVTGENRKRQADYQDDAFDAVDGAHSAASECPRVVALKRNHFEGSRPWAKLSRLVSLRSRYSRYTGVDGVGVVVIRKRVSRAKMLEFFAGLPRCLIGIEACPAAHHWARALQAIGHTVKLMPPTRDPKRPFEIASQRGVGTILCLCCFVDYDGFSFRACLHGSRAKCYTIFNLNAGAVSLPL
jgi:hypothetical protein